MKIYSLKITFIISILISNAKIKYEMSATRKNVQLKVQIISRTNKVQWIADNNDENELALMN